MSDPGAVASQPIHATLAARFVDGSWRGVLLRGPSGCGKSALALALIGRGWRLAADDRVVVWTSGGRLWGRAPAALAGLLEVRTVGVLGFPALPFAEIDRVIDAAPTPDDLERVPASATALLCGLSLPLCRLDFAAASAPDRAAAFCDALRL